MSPISIDRLVQELEELKQAMDAGELRSGEYDQRLARTITELRDRKLDADRATIQKTLADLLARGTITPSVKDHIEKRLGL
ncbi:MAG: hypothetical protein WD043_07970 [Gemmatimonadales bacterium]